MKKLLLKIPLFQLFRKWRFPKLLPLNITASVTFRCNSRCRTCNIYTQKTSELTSSEWDKIFRSLGKSAKWITFSGGEPFLFKDLVAVVKSSYDNCRPAVINIPTNGILYESIPQKVREIADYCRNSQIVVNLSIDEIGDRHDEIRGVQGNYNLALLTYAKLKELDSANVTVGIHTVISKYNCGRIQAIYDAIQLLSPDSYITEIAEERVELRTLGADITPSLSDYAAAVDFLSAMIKKQKFEGLSRITQAFRLEYYKLAERILRERTQVIPCYAGIASAHIIPDGRIWMCCVKAEAIGDLKEVNYDFKKIWFSERAQEIRKSILRKECYCPLANVAYTNMLLNWRILLKVGLNLLRN